MIVEILVIERFVASSSRRPFLALFALGRNDTVFGPEKLTGESWRLDCQKLGC